MLHADNVFALFGAEIHSERAVAGLLEIQANGI
jgi:hypothetical protein